MVTLQSLSSLTSQQCGTVPLFPHRNFSWLRWHHSLAVHFLFVNYSTSAPLNAGIPQDFELGPFSHSVPSPWVIPSIPMASVTYWMKIPVSDPGFSSQLQIFVSNCFQSVFACFHLDVAHRCLKLNVTKMNLSFSPCKLVSILLSKTSWSGLLFVLSTMIFWSKNFSISFFRFPFPVAYSTKFLV